MKFILVNHSILDFDEFRKDFFRTSAAFWSELAETAEKYDFRLAKVAQYSEFKKRAVFRNARLDMEIVLVVRKKSLPEFV
jgi:hypothetical protein